MRMVVDLSDLDRSRWVNQTGNSGHAYNDHYDDQTNAWVKGELFDWPFSRKAVDAAGGDELTLVPSPSSSCPASSRRLPNSSRSSGVAGPCSRAAR